MLAQFLSASEIETKILSPAAAAAVLLLLLSIFFTVFLYLIIS